MGRRPKPAALREAQGNPGKRQIADAAPEVEVHGQAEAPEKAERAKPLPIVKVRNDARKVYDLIAPQLRRLNFLRSTDEPAFWRYCETFARYWKVTAELDKLGGEVYECDTTNGGKMLRLRPQFIVQERLARRLETMEDKFGLSPMARQQYMLALQRQPNLPFLDNASKQPEKAVASAPSAPARPAPIGGLRAASLN